ncbi:hypothetical protein [Ktedonospora formicarum]|uniref:hypothetical protein n=1 Tax=Ktedonospora formicarum TaxID=2778364 RepID=UPI001C691C1B|nr:hypothetical protein [Ktedonospora formicarum]
MVTSPDDFEQNEPIQLQRDTTRALQPAPDNSPLANQARIQAVDDIQEVQALIAKEGSVTILDAELEERALALAKLAVKSSYPPENPPNPTEYKQMVKRWVAAYMEQFVEERQAISKDLKSLPDAKAVALAQKAREDKVKYHFPSSSRGPFHQRDLAVVSALHELGLCQNLEEYLEKIHDYVDIYEEAFRNPQKEVTWPDPRSFRA